MAELYDVVTNFVWSENFWLPQNTTWADLERDETIFIPRPADLCLAMPVGVFIFLLRLLWERFIVTPIGTAYGLRDRPTKKPLPSDVLEKAFKKHRNALPKDENLVKKLSEESGFSNMQLQRWWRRRRAVGKPSEMQRFRETSWRCLFYVGAFCYGLYILWDTPWFADTKHCWYGYPRQHVPDSIYWYYMVELGFYISLIISLHMDVKRKDFWEMIVHHVATITLLVSSWANNMVRIGTLVLCLHDASDYWLEGAKLAKYLRYHKLCDGLLLILTFFWFVTRLVIFPWKIVYFTLFVSHRILETPAYGVYFLYNGLLCTLQVLHIIWFYILIRAIITYIITGQVEQDPRSDTEDETLSEEDDASIKKEAINGMNRIVQGIPATSTVSNNNTKKEE